MFYVEYVIKNGLYKNKLIINLIKYRNYENAVIIYIRSCLYDLVLKESFRKHVLEVNRDSTK